MTENPTKVPNVEIDAMIRDLQQWTAPSQFRTIVDVCLDRFPDRQFFRERGLTSLREAFVAAHFAQATGCEAIRLCDDQFPDFQTRKSSIVRGYEVVEALQLGRKRGDENWGERGIQHDPVEAWQERAAQIPDAVRAAIERKIGKHYQGEVGLVMYLNIQEFGIRQREIESVLHAETELGREKFRDIWILWKDKLFLLWEDGIRSSQVWRDRHDVPGVHFPGQAFSDAFGTEIAEADHTSRINN